MYVPSCSCSCGNVQIKGKIVQLHANPRVPNSEKKTPGICKSIFIVQSNSIEIQNKKQSKKQMEHISAISHIKCPECCTTFRFFTNNKRNYLEKVQFNDYSQNIVNNKKEKFLQCDDQSENEEKNIDINHIEDDCDFALMFSNKYCPLIGSYKNNIVTPIIGSFENEFSDFQQTSFLA